MKAIYFIIAFTFALNLYAQEFVLGFAIDPKMAVEGPYKGKPNDIGTTFNGEFRIGFEQQWKNDNGIRFLLQAEIHPAIDYTKVSWIEVSYFLENKILWFDAPNFYQFAGVEYATIWREDPNYDYTDPNHFRKNTATVFVPGVNLELQYRIPRTPFALAINTNFFRAEGILIQDGKHVRWDTMVSVYLVL